MSPNIALSFLLVLALVVSFIRPLEQESSSYLPDDVLWVASPEIQSFDESADTGILYSRIKVPVRGRTEYASLALQASDEFVVWINGEQVASDFVAGRRLNARFDIKSLLRNGDNHIAFKIVGHRRAQPPMLRAEIIFADVLGRKRYVSGLDWAVTSVIRERAAGATSESDFKWTYSQLDPSPWQTPAIVKTTQAELEADSNLPLYVDFTRLTGGWFWPLNNGDSSALIATELDLATGTKFALGVALDGSYEVLVNGQLAASRQSSAGSMVVTDLSAFVKPGRNTIALSLISSHMLPRVAIAGFSTGPSSAQALSLPEAWGVGHSAIRYQDFTDDFPQSVVRFEDFSQRLPQFTQIPNSNQWLAMQAKARTWGARFLVVMLSGLAVYACYRVIYGRQWHDSTNALGSVASALTIVWALLLFGSSFLSLEVNHIFYGAPWLTMVALFSALLIKPEADRQVSEHP